MYKLRKRSFRDVLYGIRRFILLPCQKLLKGVQMFAQIAGLAPSTLLLTYLFLNTTLCTFSTGPSFYPDAEPVANLSEAHQL